jgi:Carbon monoxide dehydrogenase subunit G (CoxG)
VELVNEFRVPVSVGQAWKVLTDVERIAPCIPGAQLLTVDGDDFTGAVKVKVGPITVQYRGNASFQEKDAAASAGAETPQAQTVSAATQPPVDLLSVVAAPVAKRVLPVAGGLAVGIAIGFRLGRRRS